MGWMRRLSAPLRRACSLAINRLLHGKKRGRGMRKLYYDVQSCSYEDVHIMWSMLHKTYPYDSPKQRPGSSRSLLA